MNGDLFGWMIPGAPQPAPMVLEWEPGIPDLLTIQAKGTRTRRKQEERKAKKAGKG